MLPTTYRIVCIGRQAKDPWLDAAALYQKRLGHHAKLELIRLRDGTAAAESTALLGALRPDDFVIGLDERGEQHTTRQMLAALARYRADRGARVVTLLIGGASGLGDTVRSKTQALWALSRMTLPHRAALALLCEQLYRLHTLAAGQPYHRD